MIFYEFDIDGFLLGWYEADAPRVNSTAEPPPFGARSRWAGVGWVEDPGREQEAAQAEVRKQAIAAVQRRLDDQARAWGYDDIFTAVGYADEPEDAQFQAEGRALRKWRSKTWRACWNNANAPSIEALMAALPPAPERPVV